jgi:hypothetical protein
VGRNGGFGWVGVVGHGRVGRWPAFFFFVFLLFFLSFFLWPTESSVFFYTSFLQFFCFSCGVSLLLMGINSVFYANTELKINSKAKSSKPGEQWPILMAQNNPKEEQEWVTLGI